MGNIYSRIKNESKNRIYPIGNNGMLSDVVREKIEKQKRENIYSSVVYENQKIYLSGQVPKVNDPEE